MKLISENICELIRKKDFQLIGDINEDYECIICKEMLQDACSAPCGCRFCMTCIFDYLDGGADQHCPGETDQCKEQLIDYATHVQVDHAINARIAKLVVKCPEPNCNFQVELWRMADHLQACQSRLARCPFATIGCSETQLSLRAINDHLSAQSGSHNALLTNCIEYLRNEIASMQAEWRRLKADADRDEEAIAALREENAHDVAQLRFMDRRAERLKFEVQLRQDEEKLQLTELRRQLVTAYEHSDRKRKAVMDQVDAVDGKLFHLEMVHDQQHCDDFIWRIDKFREKRRVFCQDWGDGELCSEPFLSHRNGYQLRLVVYLDGSDDGVGTHLSVFFQLMRGEFDPVLPWPMRRRVTVSLVSQKTGSFHANHYYQFAKRLKHARAFHRPQTDTNEMCGDAKFISMDYLLANPSLYNDDQIFLRCSVCDTGPLGTNVVVID